MKSGAAFGGGGKIGSKTMKAQAGGEAKDKKKKEQIVKKKKKKGFLELRGLA